MNEASGLICETREFVKGFTKVLDYCIIVGCVIASDAKNLQV
jgi:hypothetical protein